MISCIYKIKNIENSKIYIGSTKDFKKRKSIHLRRLKLNKHHNIHLQRSYNKNPNKFIFEIIERCSINELFIKEQEWIDRLNPEYNIGAVGGGDNYTNHPKKDIFYKRLCKQLRECNKPKPKFKEKNPNWRGGTTFFNCPKCGKETRIGSKNIERKTCIDCRDKNGENNPFFGKSHSKETKKILSEKRKGIPNLNCSKKCCIDNVEYRSASFAAEILNIKYGTLVRRLVSKSKKFENWYYIT